MELEKMGTDTYYHITDGDREYFVVESFDEGTGSVSYDIEEHTKDEILDVLDQKERQRIISLIQQNE